MRAVLAVWGLLTSVNFAVAQIITLGLLAAVGMTIRQLPGFVSRSPADYAIEMGKIHDRYDPVLGAGAVSLLERLHVFQIFSSPWFSIGLIVLIVSIVVCTLDRTPRLWRQCAEIRVVQPDPFFDPALLGRARISGALTADAVSRSLRRHRFAVREAEIDGVRYLYGDRHRWSKMATLLTHTGLITFLIAAAITARLGSEQGLLVAEGGTVTVQPIGTPGLLLLRNLGFESPGLETGQALDFTTDLAVYRDGVEIARKVIRVNDPLAVAGYTFHENGFGPAPVVILRDGANKVLWNGPIPLTDEAGGFRFGETFVPGRPDLGLRLLLQAVPDRAAALLVQPYRVVGSEPDGTPITEDLPATAVGLGESRVSPDLGLGIELVRFDQWTLLIAKNDPGQGFVWFAFALLLSGIVIVMHFPRRRVWARLERDGSLAIAARVDDRSVDFEAELGSVLDELVAARRPAEPAAAPAAPAAPSPPPD